MNVDKNIDDIEDGEDVETMTMMMVIVMGYEEEDVTTVKTPINKADDAIFFVLRQFRRKLFR